MNSAEIFSLCGNTRTHDFDSILDAYWRIEQMLADESHASYSWLIDCTPELRTCKLCGTICNTNSLGGVDSCDNYNCNKVRFFLGICAFPRIDMLVSSGPRKKASDAFRRKLNLSGYKKVSDIPELIRFEFCVKSMLEIVSNEKNNARSA